eukprot:2817577-Pyramimonas_sp.AAC.1
MGAVAPREPCQWGLRWNPSYEATKRVVCVCVCARMGAVSPCEPCYWGLRWKSSYSIQLSKVALASYPFGPILGPCA